MSLNEQSTRNRSNEKDKENEESEFVCPIDTGKQDQWILYSGDSQHVTNNYKLIYDKVNINEVMEMENETNEEFKTKGEIKLRI